MADIARNSCWNDCHLTVSSRNYIRPIQFSPEVPPFEPNWLVFFQMEHTNVSRTIKVSIYIFVKIDHFGKMADSTPCTDDTAEIVCKNG